MPRLFHRPPKYRLHKTTKQAVVSFFGKHIYLGPYGSQRSHQRYQELLKDWERKRDQQQVPPHADSNKDLPNSDDVVASITASTLREKRLAGSPITISELILVYRRHTKSYYRKHGKSHPRGGGYRRCTTNPT